MKIGIDIDDTTFLTVKSMLKYADMYARELKVVLSYKEWRKFDGVIERAKKSCENSNINALNHFIEVDKMVQIGSGAERKQRDYKLTRYACYLIAQNGDSNINLINLPKPSCKI